MDQGIESSHPIESPPRVATHPPARESKIGILEFLLVIIVLGALAFFFFHWGLEGAIHNRPVQVVPDLKGKSISGALDMLSPLELAMIKEGEEFNSSVPIGSILRQTPMAGTKVRSGKVIRVAVSQGGETVFTPSVVGLPLRNAEMLLRQGQLNLGEVTEAYSLRLEKGLVLTQDPRADSSVERNSMVNVAVSNGPPPEGIVLMPDFLRKNVADATRWATGANIRFSVEKDPKSLFPYGTILSQDPPSDTVVSESTVVKITISGRVGVKEGATAANFQYQVPQGSSDSLVRVVLVDQHGERELFNGLRPPGSKIDLAIPDAGRARVKIFLNGILVEERDL